MSKASGAGVGASAGEKKKPKITAAEARKKLKGGKKEPAAGAESAGGKPAKKPAPKLDLPRDFSRNLGLKKDGEPEAAPQAPVKDKPDLNVTLHTTDRDARENSKVKRLLILAAVAVAAVVGVLVYLQLRDPGAGAAATLTAREMAHYKAAIAQLDPAKFAPDAKGKIPASRLTQALSDLLNTQLTTAVGGKVDMKTLPANPELYSLYLAAQFTDGYDEPIRVSVVNGKIVVRSSGPDKIDQTGGDSATARGDDLVAAN